MTRAEFMGRLRRGLVGMPTAAAAEIASDYEMHFEDGAAVGPTGAARIAISGSGDVDLTRRPASLSQSISGSGDVNQR